MKGRTLRLIAGEWRGRRLRVPSGAVRPTQDRVRQILFDILGPRIIGGPVLDLYAGSGALGLEALSRGASRATFVELDGRVRAVLEENIASLGAGPNTEVRAGPARPTMEKLLDEVRQYRWILLDPPYGLAEVPELLRWIGGPGSAILDDSGGVVLESAKADLVPERAGELRLDRAREIGDTVLRYYSLAGSQEDQE